MPDLTLAAWVNIRADLFVHVTLDRCDHCDAHRIRERSLTPVHSDRPELL
jgi:hypothetical protein